MIKISREHQKSKKVVNKPNVLCVGFAKCGTTTLYDILAQHPDIYLSKIKEPIYYSEREIEKKGVDWYLNRYYSKASSQKVIMEINPLIAKCNIPKKIARDFGTDTKIIFLIRNPISRLYSNFKMNMLAGQTFEEKKKHCMAETAVLFDLWVKENFYYDEGKINVKNVAETQFCANGRYLENIKGYFEEFPAENIRIYFFEDLISDPEKVCSDIFKFVGVEYKDEINYHIHSNESNLKPTLLGMYVMKFWFAHIWGNILIKRLPYISDHFSKILNSISWKLPELVSKKERDSTKVSEYAKDLILEYYYDEIKELEKYLNINLFEKWDLKK